MKKIASNNIVAELLVCLFVIAFVLPNFWVVSDMLMNLIKVIPGIIAFVYYLIRGNRTIFRNTLAICVILTISMASSLIYNHNADIAEILWIWSYMGLAMVLYQYKLRLFMGIIIFYTVTLYFTYFAIQSGVNVLDIAQKSIVNSISVFCIFTLFLYLLSNYRAGLSHIPYIPILLISFISLWTATRSALLCMVVLFFWSFFFNFKGRYAKLKLIVISSILVCFIIYFYNNFYSVFGGNLQDKLNRQGMESTRVDIWSDYFKATFDGIGNFVFGPSYSDIRYGQYHQYDGNAHNAFLMLHSKYGLLGFFVICILLASSIRKLIRRREIYLLALLSIVALRSMFDWTAFPGAFDIIYYFFIIYAIEPFSIREIDSCFQDRPLSKAYTY